MSTVMRAARAARYTSRQVIALAGCTHRQLDHWCRTGHLDETAHGSGSRRWFTPLEFTTVDCAVQLVRAGLTPAAAVRAARQVIGGGSYRATLAGIYDLTIAIHDLAPDVS